MQVLGVKPRLIGLVLIAFISLVSIVGVYAFAKRVSPGKLVAKEPLLTWQSPAGGSFRLRALDAAQATFHLENVGGTPVRILEVKTTCGCTTPEIVPMVVAPGQVARMEAKATPLQVGEKYVDITLLMDSTLLPAVVVKLHIIGSRKPPYMVDARGDLNFTGEIGSGETRSLYIDCVERPEFPPTPPIVKNESDFLDLDPPFLEKEQPTTSPDVVNRKWIVKGRMKSTAAGLDSGQVIVTDPWDPNHSQPVRVHRDVTPPLRVSPRRAILKASNGDVPPPTAQFVILSNEPIADILVEWEDAGLIPLQLSNPTADASKRMFSFNVSLNSRVDSERIYYVRIGRSSSTDRIRVPVAVQIEGHK
jgi:Protein of unknown function (DUF1573)